MLSEELVESGKILVNSSSEKLKKILMIKRGASVVINIIAVVAFLSCKKTREKVFGRGNERKQVAPEDIRSEIASYEQNLKVFKFEEVRKSTENFSLESRINGSMYRGEFGGEILAAKKMSRDVTKEVNILKRINHFNLIKL
ncbi:LYSM-DOMAIN RECEPTOR-LIKE KINASE [Salix koriyanagi]|uniref:LYSM-DOMAIN RECEPTOR-LIKE KINASE n=1 Tax=Salix koriyanagi TaxID=2511006 RepID=A0A9Q0PG16_9ROSI|nr:LYSM-DOMAIN RECEPTOR-LIKE KINASE [Salix koriyanagi]